MKVSCKTSLYSFCLIYICLTALAIYNLYCHEGNACLQRDKNSSGNAEGAHEHKPRSSLNTETGSEGKDGEQIKYSKSHHIEIWGKAAIGLYLWKHIFNGKLEEVQGSLVQQGNVTVNNLVFTFRTGPGVIPSTVPNDVKYLVLVVNGHSLKKINAAKIWLNYLPLFKHLKKVAVVILGNEECENNWILPFLRSRGGKVNVVFLVYDSPLVDNTEIYQWPLGVAVYREFPVVNPLDIDVTSPRSYLCNFLGTVYANSSRQTLVEVINASSFQVKCFIKGRKIWPPLETRESLHNYMNKLLNSDLTLNPVGKNSECYRIYEAMSFGSVPVVEDVVTPGNCDMSPRSPLRLLKFHKAPLIYLKDWHELPRILQREAQLSQAEKIKRRTAIIEWYEQFKRSLKTIFLNAIDKKFFNK